MDREISEQKPAPSIKETFDAVAKGYDDSLRFFQDSARLMATRGFRGLVEQLPANALDKFRKEHLEKSKSCTPRTECG